MKHFKKITSLFLALLMVMSAGAALTFSTSAADTEADYTVSSADDFVKLFKTDMVADAYAGKTIVLTKDIDMSDVTWSYAANTSFNGTLDGQGYTVKNLNITSSGIFLALENATIKNIAFSNITVNAAHPAVIARDMVAKATATFDNVYVNADITVASGSIYGAGYVAQALNGNLTFTNCVSDVTVSGTATAHGIGGFVGYTNSGGSVKMTDCAFIGDLSGASAPDGVGGFIGKARNTTTFTRCVSLGKINGSATYNAAFTVAADATGSFNVTDCYAAPNSAKAIDIKAGGSCPLSLTFNGTSAYSATTAVSDASAFNTAFTSNGGFVTEIKADALSETMPAIAKSNKWTVMEGTVAYAEGQTIAKLIPGTVAKAFFTSPVGINGVQTRMGESLYDVRVIGTVNFEDLSKYSRVGFTYEVRYGDTLLASGKEDTETVYSSIYADGETVSAEELGAEAILAIELCGLKKGYTFDIVITTFAQAADGTVIYNYGGAATFTLCDGAKVS